MKSAPQRQGQLSAVRIHETSDDKSVLERVAHISTDELQLLLLWADEEYSRVGSLGKEYYSIAVNPSFVQAPDTEVDRIMTELGSQKEPNGSWLPATVECKGKLYRVWGKTSYCG